MKPLRSLLDTLEPRIKSGNLARLYPIFQMLDNMLYASAQRPQHPPFGRDALEIKRYMMLVIVALLLRVSHEERL